MNELTQNQLQRVCDYLQHAKIMKDRDRDHDKAFKALWAATQQLYEIVLLQESRIDKLEKESADAARIESAASRFEACQMKNYELGETPADPRPGEPALPMEFRELATNTMRANMTPAQKARAKAKQAGKDLVRAYEVGATMKDLDGIFSMWVAIVEKALLEAAQPPEPKTTVATAIELRDRATQVALNFAGQTISSSDGSYELLINLIDAELMAATQEARFNQAALTAEAERHECVKIIQKVYQEWFDGDWSAGDALDQAKDRIRARSETK